MWGQKAQCTVGQVRQEMGLTIGYSFYSGATKPRNSSTVKPWFASVILYKGIYDVFKATLVGLFLCVDGPVIVSTNLDR